MLHLCQPTEELAESFEAFRDACAAAGNDDWNGRKELARTNIPAFIALLNRRAQGLDIPRGLVPETTFWIVENQTIVGEVEIRHPLNDHLRAIGGNIGYLTHPAHRNKGIATFALREALKHLKSLGATEALITCADNNHASIRVIEKYNATRIADSIFNSSPRRRYIISL